MTVHLAVLAKSDNMDAVIDDSSGLVDKTSDSPRRPEGEEGITVLVVDDERSNVESLEKIFLKENMRVLVANDAKHALEQVRGHRVQVVLTDLMMPGTTGLELLRAIKQVQQDGTIGAFTHLHFLMRLGDGWGDDAYLARQPFFRDYPRLLIHETGVHFIDTFR